ncbi:hypothetical protein [Parablautia sp. Marseille-Q6255]|uniref:hypothetical protein n=1 Tax=Parablautia sp. Marseille-Q6255 TaxID=3039593 RepID=UPI0024BC0DA8|nr:hypothetical protein [Parablautia sp. Marseille-Q6255]
MEESKKNKQPYFRTGYVIELEQDRYFSGWQGGRICGTSVEGAKYFDTAKRAESYVRRHLGFLGFSACLCRVCFVLVETETLETDWELISDENGIVKFTSYEAAKKYRKEHMLQEHTMIELFAFREKSMQIAA